MAGSPFVSFWAPSLSEVWNGCVGPQRKNNALSFPFTMTSYPPLVARAIHAFLILPGTSTSNLKQPDDCALEFVVIHAAAGSNANRRGTDCGGAIAQSKQ